MTPKICIFCILLWYQNVANSLLYRASVFFFDKSFAKKFVGPQSGQPDDEKIWKIFRGIDFNLENFYVLWASDGLFESP